MALDQAPADVPTMDTPPRTGAGAPHRPVRRAAAEARATPMSWPTVLARSTGAGATATSSTTWAPTRWSWPGSAPGCGSATTCRRSSMKDVYQHPTVRGARPTARAAPVPAPVAAGFAEVLAEVAAAWTGCRWTATSSTTWAPTRWSWPASAPGCGSATTCRRSSMKDVYQHPTISSLALALAPATAARRPAARRGRAAAPDGRPTPTARRPTSATRGTRTPGRHAAYILCGALQLLVFARLPVR